MSLFHIRLVEGAQTVFLPFEPVAGSSLSIIQCDLQCTGGTPANCEFVEVDLFSSEHHGSSLASNRGTRGSVYFPFLGGARTDWSAINWSIALHQVPNRNMQVKVSAVNFDGSSATGVNVFLHLLCRLDVPVEVEGKQGATSRNVAIDGANRVLRQPGLRSIDDSEVTTARIGKRLRTN